MEPFCKLQLGQSLSIIKPMKRGCGLLCEFLRKVIGIMSETLCFHLCSLKQPLSMALFLFICKLCVCMQGISADMAGKKKSGKRIQKARRETIDEDCVLPLVFYLPAICIWKPSFNARVAILRNLPQDLALRLSILHRKGVPVALIHILSLLILLLFIPLLPLNLT